ncbi:MAG TPA: thiol reductant ABC exporter subunit CydC [Pedococcus sp.]|jgi:thiol reductant ABC exporter CydC subunit
MSRLAVLQPGRRTLAAGLLGGAALAAGVALTATSGWLIVRASERPVILTLLTAIVAVRAFGLARPAFRYWERLRSHDAALDDLADRRTAVYRRLIPLTPARLGTRGRADLLTGVVDDLTDVVDAQVRVTVPVVSTLVAGGLTAVLTALVDPAVGLAVAALLVVAALMSWLAWWLETAGQADLLAARAEVTRVSELVALHAADLQATGAEEAACGWVRQAHEAMEAAVRRQSRGRAAAAAALPLATALATVLAAAAVADGGASAPVSALLVLAPFALADVLAPLPDAMRALARAQASDARLHGLLDQSPAVASTGSRTPALAAGPVPHLRLTGVGAAWRPEHPALGPVTLDLPPGSHVAVTGANGSGKSTLLAVLARQLDPSSGRYEVDGTDVRDLDLAACRALFAVVDDEPHVFAGTLRANLRLASPDAADAALEDALDAAGLRGWRLGLLEGLDTRLGTGGVGVSGGERARLGIARAFLSARPVLLLDEPVAHLDHPTAESVLRDLFAASAARTVVLVSHRPEGLEHVERIMDLSAVAATTTGR